MKRLFLLSASICVVIAGYAQDPRLYFNRLDINDGLSQNTVHAILQDKSGFMWFGTKDGLNRYDGQSFRVFHNQPDQKDGLGSSFIHCLTEGLNGYIWIGTDNGLYRYCPEMEKFERIILCDYNGHELDKPVHTIDCDKDGYVWIAMDDYGVFCYDPETEEASHVMNIHPRWGNYRMIRSDRDGTIWLSWYGGGLHYSTDKLKTVKPFLSSSGEDIFPGDVISCVCFSDYNFMYIGLEESGVAEINMVTSEVRKIPLSDKPLFVRDLLRCSDDELWIASESGVYIYNSRTKKTSALRSSANDPYSLSDNAVYSLCRDSEGGIWIGSYFGGVNYFSNGNNNFDKYYPSQNNGLEGKRVREICPSNDGTLWIGTEDAGLYNFDPKTKEFRFFAPSRNFSNIHGLYMDGDDLWISTFSYGIYIYNTKTGHLRKHMNNVPPGARHYHYVFALCKTATGRMYLGSSLGLHYYDTATDLFTDVPEVTNGKMINDIQEDSAGNLWVATYSNGVYKCNLKTDSWTHYLHNSEDEGSFPNNRALSIFEDSNKQIWLTTEGGGFCKYDPLSNTFRRFDSSDGMPSDVVFQIVEDGKGLFWITTNSGLVKFDPRSTTILKTYTIANGLLSNQFNYKSGYLSENGDIYFGCIQGLISFNPDRLTNNPHAPSVYITGFRLLNGDIEVGAEGSPLRQSIVFSDHIRLRHYQNFISMKIAALSYQAPRMNQLMYKLEGVDEEWRLHPSDASAITYSNIAYGKHLFRVKGSNADGVWNEEERQLLIEIMPPFYLSRAACVIYTILFIGIAAALIMYLIRKEERRQQRNMQIFEREKERELYDSKINFFTDVAHEIRTPLTLIKGPLDNILLKNKVEGELVEDLNVMRQNTDRLLELTNQLLDFRKTEKEGFSLSIARYNVSNIVQTTFGRFTSVAKQQNIEFILDMQDPDFHACVDKEAFIKILSNLLNNALKYCEKYIRLELRTEQAARENMFSVRVINDGPVVPREMRIMIFQPFFRYSAEKDSNVPGTGIGLPLALSLSELHHGTLVMDNNDVHNEFVLTLPVSIDRQTEVKQETCSENEGEEDDIETGAEDSGSLTILVVEDNREMCSFIRKQLSGTYSVLTAGNGKEAMDILKKRYVNLIVSDVMMPGMDGFELCRRVKADVNSSHIPLVLLTARVNVQSKVDGMETGADAYIEKPFSTEYLLAVIANLIKNREKLRESFTKHPLVIAGSVAANSTDTEFIARLQEIIHANFNNPDFSMEDIAETMNMSRSSFYRKIKGVLDLTPNDYLRLERLKAAAQLLKEGRYQINEVCYMVGFNSSSYFSKCFQRQFGVLPKEFSSEHSSEKK